MTIDKSTIEKIAKLARLKISEAESVQMTSDLSVVLNYFDQISQINTNQIEPLVTPTEIPSFFREDQVKSETNVQDILSNAPQKTGNLFTVPPVV